MQSHRYRAVVIGFFPLLLTIGIVLIPVVADYSDHTLAAQAVSQTGRWFWGHVLSALAFGWASLSAANLATELTSRAQPLGSAGLPFAALGCSLYAAGLGADGIGPVVTLAAGQSPDVFFTSSGWMVSGTFMAGSLLFGAGLMLQVLGVLRCALLPRALGIVVFSAAILFVGAGAIPSGWSLYGIAAAAWLTYLPIAVALWRHPSPALEGARGEQGE